MMWEDERSTNLAKVKKLQEQKKNSSLDFVAKDQDLFMSELLCSVLVTFDQSALRNSKMHKDRNRN